MSPRHKTAPDADIVEAAARVLSRLGPARMRLEDVAREVGLAPATLLLRFKTKRRLLLAVAEHGIADMTAHFAERRRQATPALDAITEISDCVREIAHEPQYLANLLAFLQLTLEDEEFRACSRKHDAALGRELEALLEIARERGELLDCPTRELARALIALTRGSLLTWSAIGRHVAPEAWVRADMETLLRPYRNPAHDARSRRGRTRLRAVGRPARQTRSLRT